jgi:oligopeptide transport system permease protein
VDHVVTGLTTVGGSVPNFVVGIALVLLLSVGLRRATGGRFYLPDGGWGLDAHLVLPLITLTLLPLAFVTRLTRASTLDALRSDHVRTARAKGLPEPRVLTRHVLDSAMLPVVTALGPLFAFLIAGSLVVERLFQIDGLGGSLVAAVAVRDYPMILGTTVVFALILALANLAVDVLYLVIDPRVEAR